MSDEEMARLARDSDVMWAVNLLKKYHIDGAGYERLQAAVSDTDREQMYSATGRGRK